MMFKVWFVFLVFYNISLLAVGEFIILDSSKNEGKIIQSKLKYNSIINTDKDIMYVLDKSKFKASITINNNSYILKVEPFTNGNTLALVYLTLKQHFPNAFVLQNTKPIIKDRIVNVYKEIEPKEEEVDNTMWTALFGLAIIGILFMFLSSDQIRRLKEKHEKMKAKHQYLEDRQHEVLSSMGENIHTIAKETMSHTNILADKVKETSLEEDVRKVIYNENELLDMTGDLIKFLRLKSKKVTISNEVFNFNNVLNELSGLLSNSHKKRDIELIFDIDKDVPRYMFSDSLHLGQILTNLLEYIIQNTQTTEIKVSVVVLSSLTEGLKIQFHIEADMKIENKDTLFKSYYDEHTRSYVGLGLFVAKELTLLMDGELIIDEVDEYEDYLLLTIPIEEKNKDKRKYRLPNKGLVGKKMLIVDSSDNSAIAIEKLFTYFKADVTILSPNQFNQRMPDFSKYEIIVLSDVLFEANIFRALKSIKAHTNIKVISLANLFNTYQMTPNNIIDITMKKPLTQEYVFDTLIQLYEVNDTNKENNQNINLLATYIGDFPTVENISLDDFARFRGSHILIVEDNRINQKVVLSMFGHSNMKLSIANNGQEALDFLEDNSDSVNFVFMDINMPVMDGFVATEKIRENRKFDNIPIVSLTALISEHEIQKMFDVGMNGYLSKPVKIEKLYSALNSFLQKDKFVDIEETNKSYVPIDLYGLNVEEGLSHTKNSTIFYQEILREFLDAYSDSDKVFERLVKEERFGQVKMLCLDMKGLTGTIGAKEMHIVINEIYQYIIYHKPEVIHSYIPKYKKELDKLKKSIDIYLSV